MKDCARFRFSSRHAQDTLDLCLGRSCPAIILAFRDNDSDAAADDDAFQIILIPWRREERKQLLRDLLLLVVFVQVRW